MGMQVFCQKYLTGVFIIVSSITVTVWHALYRGQDLNWDQKNYHIGIPYLLSHGNFWKSVAPVGIQNYFNPYLLQIEYFGLTHLKPVFYVVILALSQSIGFILAGLCCQAVVPLTSVQAGAYEKTILGLLGFALCLMAPVALSESGTTFIDLLTAAPIIGAYTLLLVRERVGLWLAPALAGGLIGAATALKLTNGVFAFGVLGFALAGQDGLSQRLKWLVLFGVAALLAFLTIGGIWHFELWTRFHNPFFPYYNNVFHSPDYGSTPFRDVRFLPNSILDAWRYPLYWMFGGSPNADLATPSTEVSMADARWAIVTFGATLFLTALALRPDWRKQRLAEPATGLLFAVLVSYLVWLVAFAIHRYMAPIDILCGAAVLILVLQIPWPALRMVALVAAAIASFVVLKVPDWGHVPWQKQWRSINASPLDFGGPAVVFLSGKPSLYVAASLPLDALYVGMTGDFDLRAENDTALTRQLKQILTGPEAQRLKEIDQGSVPNTALVTLASYGLAVTTNCRKLTVADESFRICDVERKP